VLAGRGWGAAYHYSEIVRIEILLVRSKAIKLIRTFLFSVTNRIVFFHAREANLAETFAGGHYSYIDTGIVLFSAKG
jgi:hypothetical protein